MFRHDINLADRLFIVDAQVATSADMKALKHALGAEKQDIVSVSWLGCVAVAHCQCKVCGAPQRHLILFLPGAENE